MMRWVVFHDVVGCTLVLRLQRRLSLARLVDEFPGDGVVHRLWVGPIFVKLRIKAPMLLA